MPLDDREQRILEEIERQFYEDDPQLAETVRTAGLAAASSGQLKWALLGLVSGAVLMLVFFTILTLVALAGFGLMVLSVAWLVAIARRRAGVASEGGWRDRIRRHPGGGRQR
jgi:cation transporter-like permease